VRSIDLFPGNEHLFLKEGVVGTGVKRVEKVTFQIADLDQFQGHLQLLRVADHKMNLRFFSCPGFRDRIQELIQKGWVGRECYVEG